MRNVIRAFVVFNTILRVTVLWNCTQYLLIRIYMQINFRYIISFFCHLITVLNQISLYEMKLIYHAGNTIITKCEIYYLGMLLINETVF